jgi:hypothetical protein
MATYTKKYALDFTATGDTVYTAADKLEDNIDQIITDLNSCHTTTRGDIIYKGASAMQRLAKGTQGMKLTQGADDPAWSYGYYKSTSGATTLDASHEFVDCDASGGAFTITLPSASGITGRPYIIKKNDSSTNAVTIDANLSETIDGATTLTLNSKHDFVMIKSDGINWKTVGKSRRADFQGLRDTHRGLIIQNNSTNSTSLVTQIDVDADELILQDTNGNPLRVRNVNLTIDITSSGADGLDTGIEATSTMYHIWVASDESTEIGLFSTSASVPTLPSGYNFYGRFGAVYNDASGDLVRIYQEGNHVEYTAVQTIKSSGYTLNAWTSASVSSVFPSTAKRITLAGGASKARMAFSPRSDGHAGIYFFGDIPVATEDYDILTARQNIMTGEMRYADPIYYYVSTSAAEIYAIGWEF